MKLKKVPKELSNFWQNVNNEFKYGYYKIFCWVIIGQIVHPGKGTLKSICKWIPEKILYKQLVRLLQSDKWNFMAIYYWHVLQVCKNLPPSSDGIIYLIVDKTLVEKTGRKHPVNSKVNTGYGTKWHYGFYVTILMIHWGPYRIPVDFRVQTKKEDPNYKTSNMLFQEMFKNFQPLPWCKKVIVEGDSGFASKINLKAIKDRNKNYQLSKIQYFFVFSLARTWKFENEFTSKGKHKKLKDLVNHLPKKYYSKSWYRNNLGRRRTYWTYKKIACLSGIGDVTIILSKKRHNTSPKKTKIFVTNLPNSLPRHVLSIYSRRWYIEVLNHELKSSCGLGHHQVTKKIERVQRSVAVSIISYLTILRFEHHRIEAQKHWSIFTLKHFFAIRIFQNQSEQYTGRKSHKNAA